jgi:hypothetical protein
MTLDVPKQSYRGVLCMSCRQPIPLPAIINSLEGLSENGATARTEHPERVFSLRCRACGREKPYRSADIIELEGSPRPRIDYVRGLQSRGQQGRLSRAANG